MIKYTNLYVILTQYTIQRYLNYTYTHTHTHTQISFAILPKLWSKLNTYL